MPTKVLDAAFLERCCVQLSSPCSLTAPPQQTDAMQYLLHHTPTHSDECASALVFRVAWSATGDDRFGAWALLDAAIRASMAEHVKHSARQNVDDHNTHLETSGPDLPLTNGHSTPTAASTVSPWQNFQNVVHHFFVPLVRSAWDEHDASPELAARYRSLRTSWTSLFNSVVVKQLRIAMNSRAENAEASQTMHSALRVSEGLLDALWKLRRESPRPSTVEYLVKCYGLSDDTCRSLASGKGANRAETLHVSGKALSWIAKYYGTSQCLKCDSWDHGALSCPASASRVAQLKPLLRSHAVALLQAHAPNALKNQIRSVESAGHVLDALFDRIVQQQPFETLLQAFDTLRGETTSSQSRAALLLIVSYKLKPSKVALHTSQKDEDASASPTMKKVKAHLVDKERRIREYLALERAARIVAAEFRGVLPDIVRRWTVNISSFIFVPLGLSHWDPVLPLRKRQNASSAGDETPEDKVAAAELPHLASAVALAPYKDIVDLLCRRCLDPRHRSLQACPRHLECPRDLAVAQETLKIDFQGRENTKSSILTTLIDTARDVEDKRRDGGEPSQELLTKMCAARAMRCVAARDEVVPHCVRCATLGHDKEECPAEIQRALKWHRLLDQSPRVMPHTVDFILDSLRASLVKNEERKADLGESEEGMQLAKKIRNMKGDVKVLENAIKIARMKEPQFSQDMHAQLKAIATLQSDLKRKEVTQCFFQHGFASFVFTTSLAEEILFLLEEDSSCLRVLRDPRLPLDEVMFYALITHPDLDDRPLFPPADAIKELQETLRANCLGLNDVFCEEAGRSKAAQAFALHMTLTQTVQHSGPYILPHVFAQIQFGIGEIAIEMRAALHHLRAKQPRSNVTEVPTVPTVHSAEVASPVGTNGTIGTIRSRSPTTGEHGAVAKAHRPEIDFVRGSTVLHGST